jgi:hypothetical protein
MFGSLDRDEGIHKEELFPVAQIHRLRNRRLDGESPHLRFFLASVWALALRNSYSAQHKPNIFFFLPNEKCEMRPQTELFLEDGSQAFDRSRKKDFCGEGLRSQADQ